MSVVDADNLPAKLASRYDERVLFPTPQQTVVIEPEKPKRSRRGLFIFFLMLIPILALAWFAFMGNPLRNPSDVEMINQLRAELEAVLKPCVRPSRVCRHRCDHCRLNSTAMMRAS